MLLELNKTIICTKTNRCFHCSLHSMANEIHCFNYFSSLEICELLYESFLCGKNDHAGWHLSDDRHFFNSITNAMLLNCAFWIELIETSMLTPPHYFSQWTCFIFHEIHILLSNTSYCCIPHLITGALITLIVHLLFVVFVKNWKLYSVLVFPLPFKNIQACSKWWMMNKLHTPHKSIMVCGMVGNIIYFLIKLDYIVRLPWTSSIYNTNTYVHIWT